MKPDKDEGAFTGSRRRPWTGPRGLDAVLQGWRDNKRSGPTSTFDGDTPADARRAARERSGVLLTNPDMLHAGILPHHANWARLFSNPRRRGRGCASR